MLGDDALLLVPVGAGAFLRKRGFRDVVELAVGETYVVTRRRDHGDVRRTTTASASRSVRAPRRSASSSSRATGDDEASVYFAGDTDIFDGHGRPAPAARRRADPGVGLGAEPRPGSPHAARGGTRRRGCCEPRYAVPVHWGTLFPVGLRPFMPGLLTHPPLAFERAVRALGLDVEVLLTRARRTSSVHAVSERRTATPASATLQRTARRRHRPRAAGRAFAPPPHRAAGSGRPSARRSRSTVAVLAARRRCTRRRRGRSLGAAVAHRPRRRGAQPAARPARRRARLARRRAARACSRRRSSSTSRSALAPGITGDTFWTAFLAVVDRRDRRPAARLDRRRRRGATRSSPRCCAAACATRSRRPPTVRPGVVFVQMDGVSYPLLEWALMAGNLPTLNRWVRSGTPRHAASGRRACRRRRRSARPASCTATRDDMPAFRWFEKDLQQAARREQPARRGA